MIQGGQSRVSSSPMPARYAFVSLLTSDSYLPGALALAGALQDVHESLPPDQQVVYDTVCLVTPHALDVTTIKVLRRAFNVVIGVEVIVQPDSQRLTLLGESHACLHHRCSVQREYRSTCSSSPFASSPVDAFPCPQVVRISIRCLQNYTSFASRSIQR